MAPDDEDRLEKAEETDAMRSGDDQEGSKRSADTESPSRVGSFLAYAIFIIVPPALVVWCLADLILEGSWWRISVVVGAALIAAILGLRWLNWVEAIPFWATVAILICVAFSAYDEFLKRKGVHRLGMMNCSSVNCRAQLGPYRAPQPTVAVAVVPGGV